MKAREGVMSNEEFGDLKKLYPVVEPNLSDSGAVDCVLEFITMAGKRSLPEVRMHSRSKIFHLHMFSCHRMLILLILYRLS